MNWPKPVDEQGLFGLAGDFVKLIGPRTEADPAALLLQFLTAFGNQVGQNRHLTIEGTPHYPNIYSVIVGDSAKARKGTSLNHVRNLFKCADQEWTAKWKSGVSSGEGIVWHVRNPIEKTVNKTGTDPIKVIEDLGIDDKRLFIVESEFSSLLKVMGREGNTISDVIRQAWDSKELNILTKNSSATASGAHISIVAHITKPELDRYLSKTEIFNGFGNRFLWVCARRSQHLPFGGNIDETEILPIAEKLRMAVHFGQQKGQLNYEDLAADEWCQVYERLSVCGPGLFGAITARAEAQIQRLALIFAILDCSNLIKLQHLIAAESVWRYCEDSCRFIFDNVSSNTVEQRILNELSQFPNGITQSNISVKIFQNHKPAMEIKAALDSLKRQGCIDETTEFGPEGRKRTVWFLRSTPAKCEISAPSNVNSPNSQLATEEWLSEWRQ